jgi:large subunit ribosomal protein L18
MGSTNIRKLSRLKRKKRIRKHLSGTEQKPRMSVFRSSKHIYVQLINDISGKTIAAASSVEKAVREQPKFDSKVAMASYVGKILAERALKNGIKTVVFDRNGFLYHGRVKAVSNGAREAGLVF